MVHNEETYIAVNCYKWKSTGRIGVDDSSMLVGKGAAAYDVGFDVCRRK